MVSKRKASKSLLDGAPIPRGARRWSDAVARWTHPVTHPFYAALGAALIAAQRPSAWWTVLAVAVLWGEGRIWPDSRREWLSVLTGTLTIGVLLPPPALAAGAAFVLGALEVLSESTDRGRAIRRRRAIRDAWPAVMERIGLTDGTLLDVDADDVNDSVTFRGPEGSLMPPMDRIAAMIASALRMPVARVKAFAAGEEGAATVQIRHGADRLASVTPWPEDAVLLSNGRAPVGVDAAGRRVLLSIDESTLCVGTTGAGKSGVIQSILLACLPAIERGDVELWMVDLKGGVELGMWDQLARRIDKGHNGKAATSALLADAYDEMMRRLVYTESQRKRKWSRDVGPRIIVVVDEVAQLPKDAAQTLDEIARLGRAAGVRVLCATQHPTSESLRRTTKLQCTQLVAMHVEDDEASQYVAKGRVDLVALPQEGHFYLLRSGKRARRARSYYVDDDALIDAVDAVAERMGKGVGGGAHEALTDRSSALTEGAACRPIGRPMGTQNAAPMGPGDEEGTGGRAHERSEAAQEAPSAALHTLDTSGLAPTARRIVEALGRQWRPIAGVRADLGISAQTWRRHAQALEAGGWIEREQTTREVRLAERDEITAASVSPA